MPLVPSMLARVEIKSIHSRTLIYTILSFYINDFFEDFVGNHVRAQFPCAALFSQAFLNKKANISEPQRIRLLMSKDVNKRITGKKKNEESRPCCRKVLNRYRI